MDIRDIIPKGYFTPTCPICYQKHQAVLDCFTAMKEKMERYNRDPFTKLSKSLSDLKTLFKPVDDSYIMPLIDYGKAEKRFMYEYFKDNHKKSPGRIIPENIFWHQTEKNKFSSPGFNPEILKKIKIKAGESLFGPGEDWPDTVNSAQEIYNNIEKEKQSMSNTALQPKFKFGQRVAIKGTASQFTITAILLKDGRFKYSTSEGLKMYDAEEITLVRSPLEVKIKGTLGVRSNYHLPDIIVSKESIPEFDHFVNSVKRNTPEHKEYPDVKITIEEVVEY